ncbi:MAG: DinB family protein [Ktedonobacterales bacterium]
MFSRYAFMPYSWRYTVFIMLVLAALVIVSIIRGDPTGYIVGSVLLVFTTPLVLVVLFNRRAAQIMERLHMDHSERYALIAEYKEGYKAVSEAVAQLTEEQLDRRPVEGGWTPREIVHHLADSETIATTRLHRLLAEDQPLIEGYDEGLFARKLHYDRPIAASLELLRAVQTSNGELLDWMTEEEWAREGIHSERGRYTAEDWLRTYAAHAREHAAQIRGSQ